MKHGIFISTYSTQLLHLERIRRCLETLKESGYPGDIFVVDDGSTQVIPLYYLPPGTCLIRRLNGGIARCKNTCLKIFRESDLDVAFLVDDDIEFSKDWWLYYLNAINCTGIDHFSWAKNKGERRTHQIGGYIVQSTEQLNGCFLTVTPPMIEKIGGFEVTGLRWDDAHVNYSTRAILAEFAPFFADIMDSNEYVRLSEYSQFSPISIEERCLARDKAISKPTKNTLFRPIVT